MKNLILALLIFSQSLFGAVPVTGLPPISGSDVGINDVMPMVSLSLNQTSKLKLSELFLIPSLKNPTFTTVTSTDFFGQLTGSVIGNVTGNLTGNVAGNVTGNVSGTSANVTGIVTLLHGGTGQTAFSSGALSSNGTALTSGTLSLANGGTGQTAFGSGALSSNGSALTSGTLALGNGGTGQTSFSSGALSSNGTALSSGTLSVPNGGTGATTFTAYAPILAGTTSTGAFQSAGSGISNSGYVLTSNGASASPTWQASGGGGGGTKQIVTGGNVTSDSSLNVTSYAAFSPSVTVSFTASATAKYLIWVNITSYAIPSDAMHYQVANTVGSATTVFQDSSEADSTGVRVPMYIYGIFSLTNGVAYTFELQGRCGTGGSNAITLNASSRDNGVTMIAQQIE